MLCPLGTGGKQAPLPSDRCRGAASSQNRFVKNMNPSSRTYLAGIFLVVGAWLLFTLGLELSLGWPASRAVLGHRVIGWFMSMVLLRLFIVRMRRVLIKTESTRTANGLKSG